MSLKRKHYIIKFKLRQFVPFLIDILKLDGLNDRRGSIRKNVTRMPKWIYRFLCYEIGRCALRRWVKVRSKCQHGSFNSWPVGFVPFHPNSLWTPLIFFDIALLVPLSLLFFFYICQLNRKLISILMLVFLVILLQALWLNYQNLFICTLKKKKKKDKSNIIRADININCYRIL